MKKIFCLTLISIMLFTSMIIVKAESVKSSSLTFEGFSQVEVGDTISVVLHLSDIQGAYLGVAGVGAEIHYDNEYLEYVSYESLAPFNITYAPKSSRIAGISFAKEDYITASSSDLIRLTFRAIKIGETSISTYDSDISDARGDVLPSNNPVKTITILGSK